jgi:hypothetical protein
MPFSLTFVKADRRRSSAVTRLSFAASIFDGFAVPRERRRDRVRAWCEFHEHLMDFALRMDINDTLHPVLRCECRLRERCRLSRYWLGATG